MHLGCPFLNGSHEIALLIPGQSGKGCRMIVALSWTLLFEILKTVFTVIRMKWPVSENFSTSPYEIMTCRSNVGFVILEFVSLLNTR